MRVIAFVFARGGSKGLPRKNLRPLGGLPLVAHSVTMARAVVEPDCVFVSTDSDEISDVAEEHGARLIRREPNLANDSVPEWDAWVHAVKKVLEWHGPFDVFLSLPPTSPLRGVVDVEKALEALDDRTDFVLTMTDAARSPWFNIVRETPDGLQTVMPTEEAHFTRRQDTPPVFDLTTVAYVGRPDFILGNSSIWDGRVKGVVVPPERGLDIDSELDLTFAEFLFERQGRRERNAQ